MTTDDKPRRVGKGSRGNLTRVKKLWDPVAFANRESCWKMENSHAIGNWNDFREDNVETITVNIYKTV